MAQLTRCVAAFAALSMALAGCGNSEDDDAAAPADTGADTSSETTAPPAPAAEGDRDTFVAIEGVPGVTDETIGYAVIGTRSNNPLGTCILDCYLDGIEAYFAFRNDEGGIYGRELVVSQELDDEVGQNQARALEVISGNDSFGNFNATLFAAGFGDLDDAGVPTYAWGINATEMSGRQAIFGSLATVCIECSGRAVPYAAQLAGVTNVASIGYGISENSRTCAQSGARSFELYAPDTGQQVVYVNDNLEFGLPNGIAAEVTTMQGLGVEFISTCLDLNGMKTLAQELDRQGMQDVVLFHPNTYNQQFVAEAGGIFDGDFVSAQFRPFEADGAGSNLDLFLEWMDTTGSELSELAMVGWINADLAFEGLLAAGPEFDRASVLAATNAMTAYDAGGLIVPVDWTRQHSPPTEGDPTNDYEQECTALVRVVDGAFELVAAPETPWICWPNDNLDLTEPVETNFGG